MKREPLISIIVPVYNVEEYLPACIESIISQSFRDFELILVVNELSLDRCPALCAEYAARDSRITVIKIKRGGVSAARNAGLLSAQGKYLLFIDGDDFIAEKSLENLFETLKKEGASDVIFLGVAHCFPDGMTRHFNNIYKKDCLYNKSKKDALAFISSLSDFNTSVCLKLMRREIISTNDISFEKKISFAEDTDFSLNIFLHSQTFSYCGSYIYFYRKGRKGSATYDFSEKKYRDLLTIISKWTKRAKKDPKCNELCDDIYKILAFQYCLLLSGYAKIEKPFRKSIKADTKKYVWLLGKTKDRRVIVVKWVYRFFGLRLTSAALALRERFLV